jgi:hypothetical protein
MRDEELTELYALILERDETSKEMTRPRCASSAGFRLLT